MGRACHSVKPILQQGSPKNQDGQDQEGKWPVKGSSAGPLTETLGPQALEK